MNRHSAHKLLDAFMLDLQSSVSVAYREPTIRPSGFPFCPLMFMLTVSEDHRAYTSAHYLDVGSTIHKVIQNFGSRTKTGRLLMWGNWKCSACKELKYKHCTYPQRKCRCDMEPEDGSTKEWLYDEVEVSYGVITGHIDLILKVPGRNMFVVGDFKTATFTFGRPPVGKYPFRNNVVQISTYGAILTDMGIPIIGCGLIYVDRTRPVRSPRDYIKCYFDWTDAKQASMMRRLRWVNKVGRRADRARRSIFDHNTMPTMSDLRFLVENRPCVSRKAYDAWMGAHWDHQWNPDDPTECPHLEACAKGPKTCLRHFKKVLNQL